MIRRKLKIVITNIILAGIIVAALFSAYSFYQRARVPITNFQSFEQYFLDKTETYIKQQKFGAISFALIEDGKGVTTFGGSNYDSISPDKSVFILASLSKMVSTWGVLKLLSDNNISLDSRVINYLKKWNFPPDSEHHELLTFRHLLTHTSGINDPYDLPEFNREDTTGIVEILNSSIEFKTGRKGPIKVTLKPGENLLYSSANFSLLQLLVEEISNQPFEEYMKDSVLNKLNMYNSDFDLINMENKDNLAIVPNYFDNLKSYDRVYFKTTATVALHSTTNDLVKFVLAYFNENDVLNKNLIDSMIKPQFITGNKWGLGQQIFLNTSNNYIIGHDGAASESVGSFLRLDMKTKRGIIILVSGGRTKGYDLINDWQYWDSKFVSFKSFGQEVKKHLKVAMLSFILLSIIMIILGKNSFL